MFAVIRAIGAGTLCLVAWTASCSDPDDPNDLTLSGECSECLTRSTDAGDVAEGCGSAERACSADPDCEPAMLCILTYDCLDGDDAAACASRHDCTAPAGPSQDRLAAFQLCARATCAAPCDFR